MRWSRQHSLVVAAAVVLLLGAALIQKGLYKGGLFHEDRSNDFRAYHLAAQGVWDRDLLPSYHDSVRPCLYPPAFALLVSPLGLFGYRDALVLWVALNALLLVWVFRGLDRILGRELPAGAKIAGFLLAYRPIESDFANGNANLLVLALVLLAFDLARRGREGLGGGVLALAVLSKVSPVLILPWLVYRARWRMLLGVVLGAVIIGALLPGLVLGPRGFAAAWSAWYEVTLGHLDPSSASYAEEPGAGYEPGQSLRALCHRLLRRSDATARDEQAISIHLADLPKAAADAAYLGAGAAILGGLLASAWRRAPGRRLGWRAEEIAAACAAMVLLAPLSRKAHFVALWPAAVVGFEAWRRSQGKRWRAGGAVLWFLALVLVAGTVPGLVGREAATRLLAYCPLSWAALALLVLVSCPRFFPRGGLKAADVLEPGAGERERSRPCG